MNTNFIGREKELSLLENEYTASRSNLIPVYGRRRVGKTELIRKFISQHPSIYYFGKKASSTLQIHEFLNNAAITLKQPLIGSTNTNDWKNALKLVVGHWPDDQKLIIVFDEFQWVVESCPELLSILQELWDTEWQHTGKVMLILAGSYLGFMEREVLDKKSPLFGRRSAQILLKTFTLRQAANFHSKYSLYDKLRTYLICGGIPYYLKLFSQDLSVEQNITQQFLNEYLPLFREPEFLLKEELRELQHYHAVLSSLAESGSQSHAQLTNSTKIEQRAINYYLRTLMTLGYIEKKAAIQITTAAGRSNKYALSDPLLCFWFHFVFPNLSAILLSAPEVSFANYIQPQLNAYLGLAFERACRDLLPLIYLDQGIFKAAQVGEYWDQEMQIDLVGLRPDNVIDLGECKWGKAYNLNQELKLLDQKQAILVDKLHPKYRKYTFNKLFFTAQEGKLKQLPGIRSCSLNQLYGLESIRE